jgi:hypothetical protein
MSANLWPCDRGRGKGFLRAPETGGGGFDPAAVDAAEGIAMLEGSFADGAEMPNATGLRFPGPVAQALYHDDAPVVAICGPVGSGKTTTVIYSRLRRARAMPRSVIDGVRRYKLLGLRETYRQLWSSTIPSYLETIPKALGTWAGGRGAPVSHTVAFEDEFGPIEWVTEFMAFGDDIVGSMRGIQTVDMWLNEADTVPVEALTTGIGRIKRWPGRKHFEGYAPPFDSWGQIVCDQNAPDRDNWTFQVFFDEDGRRRVEAELGIRISFHNQPGGRDPGAENLSNLPGDYYTTQVATMRMAGRGDMIARMVDNRVTYLRAGDPVFKREFNPAIHVARQRLEVDPGLPLLIGLDQGFLGAAVVAQKPAPGRWRILGALMFPRERLMAREFGNRLRDLLDAHWPDLPVGGAWGDMAGEHGASQAADENATWNLLVGKAAGIRVMPQRIGSNRLQPRLEAVRAALESLHGGEPGFLICPSGPGTQMLIAGLEARYVWKDEIDARGDRRKTPDKSIPEANVVDALQYLLLSEVRGDGASPGSFTGRISASRRWEGAPVAGLKVGHDVLHPYGGRA